MCLLTPSHHSSSPHANNFKTFHLICHRYIHIKSAYQSHLCLKNNLKLARSTLGGWKRQTRAAVAGFCFSLSIHSAYDDAYRKIPLFCADVVTALLFDCTQEVGTWLIILQTKTRVQVGIETYSLGLQLLQIIWNKWKKKGLVGFSKGKVSTSIKCSLSSGQNLVSFIIKTRWLMLKNWGKKF